MCEKECSCNSYVYEYNEFADKDNFVRPNHTYNKHHAPEINYYTLNSVRITTGTLVLIRLHKKPDLMETKVDCMKDRKVYVDKISFDLERMDTIDPVF